MNQGLTATQCTLKVELVNRTLKTLHLSTARLPCNSIVFVPVKLAETGGNVISKLDVPGHIPSESIVIGPWKSIQGTIDVHHDFPELLTDLRRSDVQLFWTYQLKDISGTSYDRKSGSLLLPRICQ